MWGFTVAAELSASPWTLWGLTPSTVLIIPASHVHSHGAELTEHTAGRFSRVCSPEPALLLSCYNAIFGRNTCASELPLHLLLFLRGSIPRKKQCCSVDSRVFLSEFPRPLSQSQGHWPDTRHPLSLMLLNQSGHPTTHCLPGKTSKDKSLVEKKGIFHLAISPAWCGSGLSADLRTRRSPFDSQSGHAPGLWARPPAGDM